MKWFVTDLSKIPLKDGSMDCILDIFSPAHYKEFQRLLSPNGYVVKVIPTKNHLREIRTKVQAHLKIQIIQMSLSLNVLRNILKPFQEKRFQPPYSCHQNKECRLLK